MRSTGAPSTSSPRRSAPPRIERAWRAKANAPHYAATHAAALWQKRIVAISPARRFQKTKIQFPTLNPNRGPSVFKSVARPYFVRSSSVLSPCEVRCTSVLVRSVSVDSPCAVRSPSVRSPCSVRVCAERLSVASPYMSVFCPLGSPFSVRVLSVGRARGIGRGGLAVN